jgi:polyhydroxyalkanoate synthesis regulator phasin
VALARTVADSLGATDAAKAKAEEVRQRTDDLRAQLSALGGPSSVAGPVTDALKEAAGIPAQVSDGKLTPEEGRARLETLRAQLRAEGLDQCVG